LEATEFLAGRNAAYFAAVSAMSGHIIDATIVASPKQNRNDATRSPRRGRSYTDRQNERSHSIGDRASRHAATLRSCEEHGRRSCGMKTSPQACQRRSGRGARDGPPRGPSGQARERSGKTHTPSTCPARRHDTVRMRQAPARLEGCTPTVYCRFFRRLWSRLQAALF
jgi:hypothetical protein